MRRRIVALLAGGAVLAGVLGITGTAHAAGKCTNPQFVFNSQAGRGMGKYFADAGWWATGGHPYEQKMGVCAYDSWYVDAKVPTNDLSVKAYPNIHYDWVTDWSTMAGMEPLDGFESLKADFAHDAPAQGNGVWNVAFDIWLNGVGDGNGTTELMVWTENSGQRPAGTKRGNVTVDGHEWELWTLREDGNDSRFNIVTYKAVEPVRSGSLDVLAFTDHMVKTGRLKANSVIGQLDYGVEIVKANDWLHFDFTDFRVRQNEKPTEPTPDPTTTKPTEPTDEPTTPKPSETDEPAEPKGPAVEAGYARVTPVPNQPTSVHVTFPKPFKTKPTLTATANSTVPGKSVVEVSATNVTTTGFDLVVYRTTKVTTGVWWQAIEPA